MNASPPRLPEIKGHNFHLTNGINVEHQGSTFNIAKETIRGKQELFKFTQFHKIRFVIKKKLKPRLQ